MHLFLLVICFFGPTNLTFAVIVCVVFWECLFDFCLERLITIDMWSFKIQFHSMTSWFEIILINYESVLGCGEVINFVVSDCLARGETCFFVLDLSVIDHHTNFIFREKHSIDFRPSHHWFIRIIQFLPPWIFCQISIGFFTLCREKDFWVFIRFERFCFIFICWFCIFCRRGSRKRAWSACWPPRRQKIQNRHMKMKQKRSKRMKIQESFSCHKYPTRFLHGPMRIPCERINQVIFRNFNFLHEI